MYVYRDSPPLGTVYDVEYIRGVGFQFLLKYTVFINSLILELKSSGLCCKLYRTSSTPVGYADDLATCSTSMYNLDRAIDIVASHGRTLRYNVNAKKSGILYYGDDKHESDQDSILRTFRLDEDIVAERDNYDHVGIRACTRDDWISGMYLKS